MSTKTHTSIERRVPLHVEFDDPVALLLDYSRNLLTVLALIEQHVNGKVRDEVSDGRDAFKRDV